MIFYFLLLIIGFLFISILFPTQAFCADSLCYIQSKEGSCIENIEGDTIYIPDSLRMFGHHISFCMDLWSGIRGPIQLMICLDQSGSMKSTDPDRKAIDVAKIFVDSLAVMSPNSMVGLVLFSGSNKNNAVGLPPLELNTQNHIDSLKDAIDNASGYAGSGTPYGAALDTALDYFELLPADTTRAIIFLSDGEPWPSSNYQDFINSGRMDNLPPVHTVYFHTGSGSQTARDTLTNLANYTGGSFTDVSNADYLYTVFLDSLTEEIVPDFNLSNFLMFSNNSEGRYTKGTVVDSSVTNPVVDYTPIYLFNGLNDLGVLYYRLNGADTVFVEKYFSLFKTEDPITPQQQTAFDNVFEIKKVRQSEVHFTDAAGTPLADGVELDSAAQNVNILLKRWPPVDGQIQVDTVLARTKSGDFEYYYLTESGPNTDQYPGSLPIQYGAKQKYNGVIEVQAVDTITLYYRNHFLKAPLLGIDLCYDTIPVFFQCADTLEPSVTLTGPLHQSEFICGTEADICWTASDNNAIASRVLYLICGTEDPELLDSAACGPGNGSWNWSIPAETKTDCRIHVRVYDAAGNHGADVSTDPFNIVERPHFTSADSITLLTEESFGYKIEYEIPQGWNQTPTFECVTTNPTVTFVPDSLWGRAPSEPGMDTIRIIMYLGDYRDTLLIRTTIEASTAAKQNIIAADIRFGLSVRSSGTRTVFLAGLEKAGELDIRIFNILGRMVFHYNLPAAKTGYHRVQWIHDPSETGNGLFIVRLNHNGRTIIKRFIKTR